MSYHESMTWRVVLEESEDGDWAAWCPQLPGCASAGTTREEAIEGIKEAIALYLAPDDLPMTPGLEVLDVAV